MATSKIHSKNAIRTKATMKTNYYGWLLFPENICVTHASIHGTSQSMVILLDPDVNRCQAKYFVDQASGYVQTLVGSTNYEVDYVYSVMGG